MRLRTTVTSTENQPRRQLRLNQITAIVKDTKDKGQSALTQVYHTLQRADTRENSPLSGIVRTFQAINDDEAERRPDESTLVQLQVESLLKEVSTALVTMYDAVATQEWGNTKARADIVLSDGTVLLSDVPPTYLLFLEKKLTDLHTVFSKLPTLPVSEQWERDPDSGNMVTQPVQTRVTKKIPKHEVVVPPTDKHPAQVHQYTEDVTVGHWTTRKFSGSISTTRKNVLLARVDELTKAVKMAREAANHLQVQQVKVGETIMDYLLNPSE